MVLRSPLSLYNVSGLSNVFVDVPWLSVHFFEPACFWLRSARRLVHPRVDTGDWSDWCVHCHCKSQYSVLSGLNRKLTGCQGLRDLGCIYRASNHKRIV
ncbi:hypothetical protein SCLCIDRAFT_192326 [Scleroderma citrinum Foug A]|uniref:Uncharacterized protein n=1 Tax=Scleroderma citrinum Foug A TaxID=1036808 RepID=A0A0C2Z4U2_9AGAM|nr:hypothetical protein SCLCIDRAFT_192326 [Scleroderma citrinum Foug A]